MSNSSSVYTKPVTPKKTNSWGVVFCNNCNAQVAYILLAARYGFRPQCRNCERACGFSNRVIDGCMYWFPNWQQIRMLLHKGKDVHIDEPLCHRCAQATRNAMQHFAQDPAFLMTLDGHVDLSKVIE